MKAIHLPARKEERHRGLKRYRSRMISIKSKCLTMQEVLITIINMAKQILIKISLGLKSKVKFKII